MQAVKLNRELAEKRHTSRANIYASEKLLATVSTPRYQAEFFIADFTPFGIGLVIKLPESQILFDNEEEVSVSFNHCGYQITQLGILANRRSVNWQGSTYTRIGIQFQDSTPPRSEQDNHRQHQRFLLNDVSSIICTTNDPLHFNVKAYFKVEDIGINGLMLQTSARNKFAMVSSQFPIELSIPSIGMFQELIQVKHVKITDDGRSYRLGCAFINPSKKTLKALAEYCLLFANQVSIRNLRKDGFPLAFNSQSIQVRTSNDPIEFQKILELRRHAYGEAGTFGRSTNDPLLSFTDRFDQHSRQIIVKIGDRIVGAGRVVFTDGNLERSSLIQHISAFPDFFKGQNFVEFSLLSTDPEYRDGAVLMRLGMEMTRISIIDGTRYIAAMARDYMHPTYEKFGFRPYGDWFKIAGHNVKFLYADCQDIIKGHHMKFIPWSFMVAPMIREQNLSKQININPATRIKAFIGHQIRPIIQWQLERYTEKRKKR